MTTYWCVHVLVCLCAREGGYGVLTVPATDFDDIKVSALNLDNPKSHT